MNAPAVQHLPDEHRYEIRIDDHRALLTYQREDTRIVFDHTFVPVELRGQGIAEQLVRTALVDARAEGLSVVPQCSYVEKFIARHREFSDLLDQST